MSYISNLPCFSCQLALLPFEMTIYNSILLISPIAHMPPHSKQMTATSFQEELWSWYEVPLWAYEPKSACPRLFALHSHSLTQPPRLLSGPQIYCSPTLASACCGGSVSSVWQPSFNLSKVTLIYPADVSSYFTAFMILALNPKNRSSSSAIWSPGTLSFQTSHLFK